MILKDQNTREHSAWTIGNEYPMHGVCTEYPTQYISRMGSKGEARRRNRHNGNNKKVVRNLGERNVGTKEESPKQSLTSAEDLTIELPEGRYDKNFQGRKFSIYYYIGYNSLNKNLTKCSLQLYKHIELNKDMSEMGLVQKLRRVEIQEVRSASQADYCTLQQRKRSTLALCLHSAVYVKHTTCIRQWINY